MKKIIEMKGIRKNYLMGEIIVRALSGVDITVEENDFIAIMGASGSGKSTLMNIIGCLDSPDEGVYKLDDIDVSRLRDDQYAEIRNQKIGFVFQNYNLLARTTALENVELPLLYDRYNRIKNVRKAAIEALEKVGLSDRMHHEPSQLSGGQQQRVTIARALINNPALILADEPTGNLDTKTSYEIMELFKKLNEQGVTIVMVTHESDIAAYAKRGITMRDGLVEKDVRNGISELTKRGQQ